MLNEEAQKGRHLNIVTKTRGSHKSEVRAECDLKCTSILVGTLQD